MNIYYVKFDDEGYIIDLSLYGEGLPGYLAVDVTPHPIPEKVMRRYYKWNNGFEIDADKAAIIDAELDAPPPES